MKTLRTHDALYLEENRYDNVKESFKFLTQVIGESFDLNQAGIKVSDFGCAAGELLYYLRCRMPHAVLEGYDLLPELIDKARQNVPGVKFAVASVLDNHALEHNDTDVAILVGVHSIFDEFETCFGNLIDWTRSGGSIYIFGMFNPYPIDVFVKYRESKHYQNDIQESGWNIISMETVSGFLASHPRVSSHRFVPFDIGIDLPKNPNDFARSWTEKYQNGRRVITNGLCLNQPHHILHVSIL